MALLAAGTSKALSRLLHFPAVLLDFAVPHLCISCGEQALWNSRPALCAECADTGWRTSRCPRCGAACHCREARRGRCRRCRAVDGVLRSMQSLGPYRGWLRRAILIHKFRQDRLASLYLGKAAFGFSQKREECAVISFVPSHPDRIRERGGTGQHIPPIIRRLARAWDLPVTRLLAKKKTPRPQVELSGAARRKAVQGTFVYAGPENPPEAVMLFDDVWTTGSTLLEAACVLRASGVMRVHGFVFAVSDIRGGSNAQNAAL